jgi:hypothetical protein
LLLSVTPLQVFLKPSQIGTIHKNAAAFSYRPLDVKKPTKTASFELL